MPNIDHLLRLGVKVYKNRGATVGKWRRDAYKEDLANRQPIMASVSGEQTVRGSSSDIQPHDVGKQAADTAACVQPVHYASAAAPTSTVQGSPGQYGTFPDKFTIHLGIIRASNISA